jgi:hypothetical protein
LTAPYLRYYIPPMTARKPRPQEAENPFTGETPSAEKEALITQAGGDFFAPKTERSNPDETPRPRPHEGPVEKISSSIYNMRLTEAMHTDLRRLKASTGITVQAHVRRAILDYLHEMKTKHPDYFTVASLPAEDTIDG